MLNCQWTQHRHLLSSSFQGDHQNLLLSSSGKFLGDQRFSYGQPLTLTFRVPPGGSPGPVLLRLEGAGLALTLRHSGPAGPQDTGQPGEVQLKFQ